MTPYVSTARRYSKAKLVLRSHNLEYLIWKRLAEGSKNIAKKFYLNHLAKQLEQYELSIIPRMDGIITISQDDHKKYEELTEGSLSWSPNLEGVTWFLEKVWRKIQPEFPSLKFYLAGRDIPNGLVKPEHENVKVVGEVENAKQFISSKAIMLVPILSAGGMRVKIIEGMALGKTILSTTLGAEGIDYEKDKDILIADTAEEFKKQLKKILQTPDFLTNQVKGSRRFVETNYDNQELTVKLLKYYKTLCLPE